MKRLVEISDEAGRLEKERLKDLFTVLNQQISDLENKRGGGGCSENNLQTRNTVYVESQEEGELVGFDVESENESKDEPNEEDLAFLDDSDK